MALTMAAENVAFPISTARPEGPEARVRRCHGALEPIARGKDWTRGSRTAAKRSALAAAAPLQGFVLQYFYLRTITFTVSLLFPASSLRR